MGGKSSKAKAGGKPGVSEAVPLLKGAPSAKAAAGGGGKETPSVVLTGAGQDDVNGTYVFVPGKHANRIWGTAAGHYQHIENPLLFLGFQDCRPSGHREWCKWMVISEAGILYAAHTKGQVGVPPREGKWETVQSWKNAEAPGGAHPPPTLRRASPHPALPHPHPHPAAEATAACSNALGDKFSLKLAEGNALLALGPRQTIEDRWNKFKHSYTLATAPEDAVSFSFGPNGKQVSISESDPFLAFEINYGTVHTGSSCCAIHHQDSVVGHRGWSLYVNQDGTVSPAQERDPNAPRDTDFVLGFGPVTFCARQKQPIDPVRETGLILVAPGSPHRLVVGPWPPAPAAAPPANAVSGVPVPGYPSFMTGGHACLAELYSAGDFEGIQSDLYAADAVVVTPAPRGNSNTPPALAPHTKVASMFKGMAAAGVKTVARTPKAVYPDPSGTVYHEIGEVRLLQDGWLGTGEGVCECGAYYLRWVEGNIGAWKIDTEIVSLAQPPVVLEKPLEPLEDDASVWRGVPDSLPGRWSAMVAALQNSAEPPGGFVDDGVIGPWSATDPKKFMWIKNKADLVATMRAEHATLNRQTARITPIAAVEMKDGDCVVLAGWSVQPPGLMQVSGHSLYRFARRPDWKVTFLAHNFGVVKVLPRGV